MRVDAIMPTYNHEAYVREAIASVQPQVDRLVVVNDASTDGTVAILEVLGVPVIHHETNRGTAAALNTGFAATEGADLVTWVSSDNVYYHGWRKTLEAAMADDVGITYSGFHKGGPRSTARFAEHTQGRLVSSENCYYGPSFLVRREVWANAGDHRGGISHDYDHFLRMEEACWDLGLRIVGIKEPLAYYRMHNKRMTVVRKDTYDAPQWRQEALERRAQR